MDKSIKTIQKLDMAFEPYRVIFRHTKGKKEAAPKKRKEKKKRTRKSLFWGIFNYTPIFCSLPGVCNLNPRQAREECNSI